ncbi:hypothetical protein TNCV_4323891 [Trichonephila clavipes]|nr:hypothetical protein TNCV_4323891 [Trichonephila clavipes]
MKKELSERDKTAYAYKSREHLHTSCAVVRKNSNASLDDNGWRWNRNVNLQTKIQSCGKVHVLWLRTDETDKSQECGGQSRAMTDRDRLSDYSSQSLRYSYTSIQRASWTPMTTIFISRRSSETELRTRIQLYRLLLTIRH